MSPLLRWQSTTQAFREALGEGQVLTMLRLPAGRFLMGSPDQEAGRDLGEAPMREVEMQEFLMASTPITRAQWQAVAGWEERPGESWQLSLPLQPSLCQGEEARLGEGKGDTSQRPVERIRWEEAMEFCRRLSQRTRRRYTLPSEAQWEYACRAGSTSPYAFGTTLTAELVTLGQQTTPVQRHPANAWGLCDMHGNVWEWCLDHWHANYRGAPNDGTAWIDANAPANADRVVRGGAWSDPPSVARSACRHHLPPQSSEPAMVGIRVVCLPGGLEPGWGAGEQRELQIPDRQALVVWIDDHHHNNRRERSELEGEGVRFQLASTDEELMKMLAAAPVALVISDMHRYEDPEAGLQTLRRIREAKISVPVVFYVGVVNKARITDAREAGAVAVINQPQQLLKTVRELLADTISL